MHATRFPNARLSLPHALCFTIVLSGGRYRVWISINYGHCCVFSPLAGDRRRSKCKHRNSYLAVMKTVPGCPKQTVYTEHLAPILPHLLWAPAARPSSLRKQRGPGAVFIYLFIFLGRTIFMFLFWDFFFLSFWANQIPLLFPKPCLYVDGTLHSTKGQP